jgi:hypothetical protein
VWELALLWLVAINILTLESLDDWVSYVIFGRKDRHFS